MTATAQVPVAPDLAALQQRAAQRAAERAGGQDRLRGHIVCDGLVRIFKTEGVEVVALQGLDLVIDRGELVAIVGASGSGKSTLLNILSGLDTPTAGIARVADYDLLSLSAKRRLSYRRELVGFVWQQTGRNLLPYLTALENVELPMQLAGKRSRRARRERARSCSTWSAWATARIGGRGSSAAASSSGARWRWRWPTTRRCSSLTSRPASWTRRPVRRSSRRCAPSTPSWA